MKRPVKVDICSGYISLVLVEWDLYDVLLDDLSLWDGDVLLRAFFTAQSSERTAPGQRQRSAKRRLHGLPTRDIAPFPRLSFQTLDALQTTVIQVRWICIETLWWIFFL